MAKIVTVKKKKRRINLFRLSIGLFFISAAAALFSSLFLRSYNNSLSTQKQSIDSQIATIQTQNDAVKVEIQTLSSSDRVDEIAAGSGMSRNQNNVITITDGSQDGEGEINEKKKTQSCDSKYYLRNIGNNDAHYIQCFCRIYW